MSIYKPKKSPYWAYDFQIRGRRFHGTTGVETKRAAERIERDMRVKAAEGTLDDASRITLDDAAARWIDEVGVDLKDLDRLEARIERALTCIGPKTPICDITADVIAKAMTKRRKQGFTKSTKKGATVYYPSASTVNRDMIDAVRPILNRAVKTWGARLAPIDWNDLRLSEPKPKPREFTGDQFDLVLNEVRPHWHDMIRFARRYGCRLSELFFSLDDIDVADINAARVSLRERKGGDDHIIPILPEDAAMLSARMGRARAAKFKTVWFRELKPLKGGQPRLRALTYNGAAIALRRAMTRSGLREAKGMKGAHDLRHDAGMKTLRGAKNLRVAQRLLGHKDLKSTLVYAHAMEDDLRDALLAIHRNSPGLPETAQGISEADQTTKATGTEGS